MQRKLTEKIVIIGAGFVGSTTAYTLMLSGLISELVLIDIDTDKARGEAMDLNHGMSFSKPINIIAGGYEDCAGADIVIIAAGANQRPGETRLDLSEKNTAVFAQIIPQILKYNDSCILLVVTNPVDILTYATYKISGFPKNRVIGSGTVLDTSRLRYALSSHVNLDIRNVHGYIIGEHGDTEVAVWSLANISGILFDDYCKSCQSCDPMNYRDKIMDEVKNAAYSIIKAKGATYYAVALAIRRIVEAIIRNENSVLTVSTLLEGEYGINDTCLSIPCVINQNGIDRVISLPLTVDEKRRLDASAETLKSLQKKIRSYWT